MTHLCLAGSSLFVGVRFDEHPGVNAILRDPKNLCVVLYPGKDSINIEEKDRQAGGLAVAEDRRLVVFVIDGTWPCAKKMLERSPRIAVLPRISFTSTKLSEYKIRKQPREYCLSTVEAVHRVLEILEPSLDASNLLLVFREMVNAQLGFSKRGHIRRTQGSAEISAH
jgi:DTW domain-containing protein YfiP